MNESIKILHLEDFEPDTELVSRLLKKDGMQFNKKWVSDKNSFIESLKTFSPDIVLSDHMLPDIDSREALEIFKSSGLKIPFILITATVSEEYAVEIIKLGADDYILKENPIRLASAIKAAIRQKQMAAEHEKAIELLDKSEKRFRALIENSADVILLSDRWQKVKYISSSVKNLLGYKPEDMIGRNSFEFIHPEDYDRMKSVISFLHEKHGNTVKEIQCRVRNKNGRWIWVEGIGSNMTGDPAVQSIVTNFQDITARKEFEVKLGTHAKELEASNKELERFAYVTSHDLQEPLRMINSFLQLLEKKYAEKLDETALQYIKYAVEGADRMKTLILDLLNYSRVGTDKEKCTLVNINEIIDELEKKTFITRLEKTGGKIIAVTLPEITGYKTQLCQLFQNLISNALKYMGNQPPVIKIGYSDKGTHWEFYVSDNGIGIDEQFYDKIFIIFQRLHGRNEYSGTGIGLAICKKITDKHKGTIWVNSETGKGSTFYFTISKNL